MRKEKGFEDLKFMGSFRLKGKEASSGIDRKLWQHRNIGKNCPRNADSRGKNVSVSLGFCSWELGGIGERLTINMLCTEKGGSEEKGLRDMDAYSSNLVTLLRKARMHEIERDGLGLSRSLERDNESCYARVILGLMG